MVSTCLCPRAPGTASPIPPIPPVLGTEAHTLWQDILGSLYASVECLWHEWEGTQGSGGRLGCLAGEAENRSIWSLAQTRRLQLASAIALAAERLEVLADSLPWLVLVKPHDYIRPGKERAPCQPEGWAGRRGERIAGG